MVIISSNKINFMHRMILLYMKYTNLQIIIENKREF